MWQREGKGTLDPQGRRLIQHGELERLPKEMYSGEEEGRGGPGLNALKFLSKHGSDGDPKK